MSSGSSAEVSFLEASAAAFRAEAAAARASGGGGAVSVEGASSVDSGVDDLEEDSELAELEAGPASSMAGSVMETMERSSDISEMKVVSDWDGGGELGEELEAYQSSTIDRKARKYTKRSARVGGGFSRDCLEFGLAAVTSPVFFTSFLPALDFSFSSFSLRWGGSGKNCEKGKGEK